MADDVLMSHTLKLADLPSQRHGELLGTIGDRDICRDYFTGEFYSVRHTPNHLFNIVSSRSKIPTA